MARKISVVPYSSGWPVQFELEKQALHAAFHSMSVTFHHIGSTAVEGMSAKPIIDILAVADDLEAVDQREGALIKLGYTAKGENGIAGRRFFQKGGDQRTHHLHICEKCNPEISRHLIFRDYLRLHKEEADRYSRLKEKLAERFETDVKAYVTGKEQYVRELELRALQWHDKKE